MYCKTTDGGVDGSCAGLLLGKSAKSQQLERRCFPAGEKPTINRRPFERHGDMICDIRFESACSKQRD